MMNDDDENQDERKLEEFLRIKDVAKETFEKLGLYMVDESFAIIPRRGGPNLVQCAFLVGDRALDGRGIEPELSPEEQKIKDEFDMLIAMDEDLTDKKTGHDVKQDDAIEHLRDWMNDDS